MSKSKISDGYRFNWTATAAKSSGDIVQDGAIVGVAVKDAVTGDVIALDLYGEYRLTKPTGVAFAVGANVYVTSGGALAATATGNQFVGISTSAVTSATNATTATVLVGYRASVDGV